MGMPVIVGSDINRSDAVTDIIQSVALQQTALSHILNAEGEKIQKVVGKDDVTTKKLLEVNKSVNAMVQSITRLEMVLQSKLQIFEDCLCVENKEEA